MTTAPLIRFLPGVVGALSAYIVLKLVGWATSLTVELLAFAGTYLAVTVALDVGLKRYGREER